MGVLSLIYERIYKQIQKKVRGPLDYVKKTTGQTNLGRCCEEGAGEEGDGQPCLPELGPKNLHVSYGETWGKWRASEKEGGMSSVLGKRQFIKNRSGQVS